MFLCMFHRVVIEMNHYVASVHNSQNFLPFRYGLFANYLRNSLSSNNWSYSFYSRVLARNWTIFCIGPPNLSLNCSLLNPFPYFEYAFYKKTFSFFLEQEHCHVNRLSPQNSTSLRWGCRSWRPANKSKLVYFHLGSKAEVQKGRRAKTLFNLGQWDCLLNVLLKILYQ